MVAFSELSLHVHLLEQHPLADITPKIPEDDGAPVIYRLSLVRPMVFSEAVAEAERVEKIIATYRYDSESAGSSGAGEG